jgi:hypothetical protein
MRDGKQNRIKLEFESINDKKYDSLAELFKLENNDPLNYVAGVNNGASPLINISANKVDNHFEDGYSEYSGVEISIDYEYWDPLKEQKYQFHRRNKRINKILKNISDIVLS